MNFFKEKTKLKSGIEHLLTLTPLPATRILCLLLTYNSLIKQKGLLAKSINRPKLKARVLRRALAPGENHFLAFTELPATHRK